MQSEKDQKSRKAEKKQKDGEEIAEQKDLEKQPKIDPLLLSIYIFGIAIVLIWGGALLYRVS